MTEAVAAQQQSKRGPHTIFCLQTEGATARGSVGEGKAGRKHTPQSMPTDRERVVSFLLGALLCSGSLTPAAGINKWLSFLAQFRFVCLCACVCVSAARVVSFCSYCNLVQLYAAYLIYILTRTHTHTHYHALLLLLNFSSRCRC